MTTTIKNKRPLFSRIFAFMIDLIILSAACAVLSKYLIHYFPDAPLLFHCIGTLLCLFYFAFFNSNIGGAKTIGKMICGIHVTALNHQQISLIKSCARSSIVILPLCFIGYLQPFTQQSILLNILTALLISIVMVSFYLVIFNRHTSQTLHDIIVKTQIQNKAQSFFSQQPIWKVHYFICIGLALIIIAGSLWSYAQNDHSLEHEKTGLSKHIKSLSIENRYVTLGEARSQSNVLIFNVGANENLEDRDFMTAQIMALKSAQPRIYSENAINQVQFNSSYQFGLAKISKSVIYDLSFNQGQALISFNGDSASTGVGF